MTEETEKAPQTAVASRENVLILPTRQPICIIETFIKATSIYIGAHGGITACLPLASTASINFASS